MTAIFLIAALLTILFVFPPSSWLVFCALICAGGAWEWGKLAKWDEAARAGYALLLGSASFFLASTTSLSILGCRVIDALQWLAIGFWLLVVPFWLWFRWRLNNWSSAVVGFIVLVPPALVFALLRNVSPVVVLMVAAIVWIADIAAYFTGRAFGYTKLAPAISPGKTWAGAIGAVVAVVIYCTAMLAIYGNGLIPSAKHDNDNNILSVLVAFQPLFVGLAVLSIIGDLFESLLKRHAGLKDSGNFLPGHGGILDRIDSLTSTLPLVGVFFI